MLVIKDKYFILALFKQSNDLTVSHFTKKA